MANNLLDPPDKIIRRLMVDLGVATMPAATPGAWPAYFGKEPPTPDDCITVRVTDAPGSARAMPTGEMLGPYGFQVRVRSSDGAEGWVKADSIQAAFQDVLRRVVYIGSGASRRDYFIQAIVQVGNVIPLGTEPTSQRSLHTFNATVNIRQLS